MDARGVDIPAEHVRAHRARAGYPTTHRAMREQPAQVAGGARGSGTTNAIAVNVDPTEFSEAARRPDRAAARRHGCSQAVSGADSRRATGNRPEVPWTHARLRRGVSWRWTTSAPGQHPVPAAFTPRDIVKIDRAYVVE